MPWFKVDDTFGFHHKAMTAGNAALGLWVRAGAWSAQTLTEGFIPDHIITALGGARSAPQLVAASLWRRVDGGYQFHDWCKYQPTKAAVELERESARDRQKRAREKAKSRRDATVSHAVTHGEVTPLVTVPPSHPIPSRPKEKSAPAVPAGPTAQTLVAEWIDNCGTKPPSRVIGQVSKELKTMLDEGIPYADVRRGLQSWQGKGLHPSTLASEVHACRTPRAARPTRAQAQLESNVSAWEAWAAAEDANTERKAISG